MDKARRYDAAARNPLIMGVALLCLAAIALSQLHGVSSAVFASVALVGVAIATSLTLSNRGGWSVSDRQVRLHVGRDWELRVSPEQIHHASRISETGGIQIAMTDGRTREVPDQCVGEADALLDALETVGVDVREL